jgi:1-acyl-sn-glycerol-3-phosphate acyltransferase
VARIAARTGVPVVPLGIRGAFESMPRQRRFPRPSRVSVHVGEPIVFDGSPRTVDPLQSEIRAFNRILRVATLRLVGKEDGIPVCRPESSAC